MWRLGVEAARGGDAPGFSLEGGAPAAAGLLDFDGDRG
jgi:hypothetical protein